MILKNLHIYRAYGGIVKGDITFENNKGSVQLNLSPERCREILGICADSLVENAKDVAENLKAEIINQIKILPAGNENEKT